MPLPYITEMNLNIPGAAFNADGLAVLIAQGGRYGGDWHIGFTVQADQRESLGGFQTEVDDGRKHALERDPGYPDRAIESAFIWLLEQAKPQGLRVVSFTCENKHYGPDEAPYFCAARVIVANGTFIPKPGVFYADALTLDEVMGYTAPRGS